MSRRVPSRITLCRSHLKARAGFTLVELLVVIGIIAVLISILLPALNKARNSANNLKCLSNLRQIGMGCVLYMNSNKGILPPVRWYPPGTSNDFTPGCHWVNMLSEGKYVKGNSSEANVFICPNSLNELVLNWFDHPPTNTSNSGYQIFEGSAQRINPTDHSQDVACSYAVNATWGTDPTPPWWVSSNFPGPKAKLYTELFPFVYHNPGASGRIPVAPHVSATKDSAHVALVFDGFYMHEMVYNHFQLRHGNPKAPPKDRVCNIAFLDGHAEGLRGAELPKSTDNFYLPDNLTKAGLWGIKLAVAH